MRYIVHLHFKRFKVYTLFIYISNVILCTYINAHYNISLVVKFIMIPHFNRIGGIIRTERDEHPY